MALQSKVLVKELKRGTSLRRIVKLEDVLLGTVQKVKKILKKKLLIKQLY